MIDTLHEQINKIVPINGLSYDYSNNTCIINYVNPNEQITNEQQQLIDQLVASWPLQNHKSIKLEELEVLWNNLISNGWSTPYGWKLGLTTTDVTLLTGVFILAKEASALGISDPVSVIDTSGISHSLSLTDLTLLMLQYGNARSLLSQKYSLAQSQINESNSIEDLNAIDIANILS